MTTKNSKKSKVWNVSLWVAQILLAGMFLMAGIMKTFTPIEELAKMVPLAAEIPALIRFIGISELAGAIGLILPAALRIRPQLTTVAAGALALVMVLAVIFHISKAEYAAIGTPIVLGILAAFIVFGRLNKAPVSARSSHTHVIAEN
jgi:putative oxidoreductase